ncbi:hypothetical protein PTSG_07878 [Salpingoeca rosetta]|uniref:Protein kinase domain-containing protein n=1 Tax=Salpingoeca rosetta (strain ATCC 50818 / BSB-021) TaxID=946362 RepID=F2UGL1_SALR5|nr:uncharacterized protein PTSG_07878 [Salpingoeca rosetta]EGD75761.1 hypothetical protein PTSG_07878 [Salpingoeca rosetta]|eukprot:XP_004991682.1 hypothetical protein PTSG_07878 [Salpingoeca rosetta]
MTGGPLSQSIVDKPKKPKCGFGVTYLAQDNSSDTLVSVKCIDKSRVLEDNWEPLPDSLHLERIDNDAAPAGRLPREIALLLRLDHPNIPHVIAVYHNATFFQMVVPSHEPAFDLFRFIDENPAVEEPIASHIFRQFRQLLQ